MHFFLSRSVYTLHHTNVWEVIQPVLTVATDRPVHEQSSSVIYKQSRHTSCFTVGICQAAELPTLICSFWGSNHSSNPCLKSQQRVWNAQVSPARDFDMNLNSLQYSGLNFCSYLTRLTVFEGGGVPSTSAIVFCLLLLTSATWHTAIQDCAAI